MQTKTISNTPPNQQKIVIYTRNTACEQPVGHRLHRDIQVLRNKYERAGYEISKVYCEPSSLSDNKERPVLKQLLGDAAKGLFWVVLVWDVFSLTSDGEELQLIEASLLDMTLNFVQQRRHSIPLLKKEGKYLSTCAIYFNMNA